MTEEKRNGPDAIADLSGLLPFSPEQVFDAELAAAALACQLEQVVLSTGII